MLTNLPLLMKNLFSEAAKSFGAKFVEWVVRSSWLLAFDVIDKDVTLRFSRGSFLRVARAEGQRLCSARAGRPSKKMFVKDDGIYSDVEVPRAGTSGSSLMCGLVGSPRSPLAHWPRARVPGNSGNFP